jgi:hypothetical protein
MNTQAWKDKLHTNLHGYGDEHAQPVRWQEILLPGQPLGGTVLLFDTSQDLVHSTQDDKSASALSEIIRIQELGENLLGSNLWRLITAT